MNYDELRLDIDASDGVAVLTLDRVHRHNALNTNIRLELNDAVQRVADDDAVGALVLTGAGEKAFSVGADIKSPDSNHSVSEFDTYVTGKDHKTPWYDTLSRFPKGVVAAVNGYCAGSGLQLALTADVFVGTPSARFWIPQVGLGLAPHVGTMIKLSRIIGQQRTLHLALTGSRLNAQDALAAGLLTEIVEPDRLLERARAIAATIASQPRLAVRMTKESYFQGIELTWEQAMRVDAWKEFCMWQTSDRRTRHQQFVNA